VPPPDVKKRKPAKRPQARRNSVGRPRKDGNNLDVDRIVEAAWRVVDREGLAALSTRRVAAELEVQSPALYWHVKSKQELLSLMIERAIRDSMRSPQQDLPWWEWLRAYAQEQRRILLMHRDSGQIASTAPPTDYLRTQIVPQALVPMLDAGLPRDVAAAAVGALASFVLGSVIYEQSEFARKFAESFVSLEETFSRGLDCFIAGLRSRSKARGVRRRTGSD
jgi:TetR/AcrR family transcriptional regulator, tetracycline repressor protein